MKSARKIFNGKLFFAVFFAIFLSVSFATAEGVPEVLFWSEWKDVKLFINNKEIGLLPQVMNNLLPGNYQIRAEKRNFGTKEFWLEITSEEYQSYEIQLEAIHTGGIVHFEINPFPQKIYVDDEKYDLKEDEDYITLEKGFHRVKFEYFGYKPIFQSFRIVNAGVIEFKQDFEPVKKDTKTETKTDAKAENNSEAKPETAPKS